MEKIEYSKCVRFEPYLLMNYVIWINLISDSASLEERDESIGKKSIIQSVPVSSHIF